MFLTFYLFLLITLCYILLYYYFIVIKPDLINFKSMWLKKNVNGS